MNSKRNFKEISLTSISLIGEDTFLSNESDAEIEGLTIGEGALADTIGGADDLTAGGGAGYAVEVRAGGGAGHDAELDMNAGGGAGYAVEVGAGGGAGYEAELGIARDIVGYDP